MNKIRIRDHFRLVSSLLCVFIYIPHIVLYLCSKDVKSSVDEDIKATGTDYLNIKGIVGLIYLLHNDRYFRKLFYFRIGPIYSLLISWWRPGDRYFVFSYSTKIGPGVKISHPYSTILNAESIGKNFSCIHCTTIGKKNGSRPVIGDNVTLGANVIIVGNVRVGDNVVIGAGCVVVKDIPDNAVVVGNPARIIKYNSGITI